MGCGDHHIYFWDLAQDQPRGHKGHKSAVVRVSFSRDGELLASGGWDGAICLWDPVTREVLTRTAGRAVQTQFDPRSSRLGIVWQTTALNILDVAEARECRTLARQTTGAIARGTFSADGQMLAVAFQDGIGIWKMNDRAERVHLDFPWAFSLQFTADGKDLVASGQTGVMRWPINLPARDRLDFVIGSAQPIEVSLRETKQLCLIPKTRKVLVSHPSRSQIIDIDQPSARMPLHGHDQVHFVTASPDGNWLATGPRIGQDVVIWDAKTAQKLRTLPIAWNAEVLFSPDGRWLMTGWSGEYALWDVSSWEVRHRFSAPPGLGSAAMAFCPDGRILALRKSNEAVQLLDPVSGAEIASLDGEMPWPLCFSPDGTVLAVADDNTRIKIWDLRLVRQQLARISLDWDLPPYPEINHVTPQKTP